MHSEIAENYFRQGFNCSQSVAAAFSSELGIPPETILKMTVGFGAGVGRLREVCGAFSGMVFVAGALYGNADPEGKSAFYAEIQKMAGRFKEENGFGSLICRELLGLEGTQSSPVAEQRTEKYYSSRPCQKLVALAAQLMEEYISQHPLPVEATAENT